MLFLSRSALAAVSSFGPEVPLTREATPTLSTRSKFASGVATNGDGFLVAWSEMRDRAGIYATRLDAAGHAIDQPSFFVMSALGTITLAGAGRDTLIAVSSCETIDLTRVREDGSISPTTHINIATPNCGERASVATNGRTVIVVFGGVVTVLDESLRFVRQFNVQVVATGAVATNDGDYVVITSQQDTTAKLTHLDADGAVVSTATVTFPNRVNAFALAWNGAEYLALAAGPTLDAVRIDASGNPVAAARVVAISRLNPGRPQIAWDGNSYIAAYAPAPLISEGQFTFLLRLDRDANTLAERLSWSSGDTPIAVRHDVGIFASTADGGHASPFSVDTLAAVATPQLFSFAAAKQSMPRAVDTAGVLTAFWREQDANGQTLKAKMVGGSEKTLLTGMSGDYIAGFDGARYVVVWQRFSNTIDVQRFNADLTPFDASPITFDPLAPIGRPGAAIADGRVLIAWPQFDDVSTIKQVVIDTTAAMLTFPQPMTISTPPHANHNPAVAWDGHQFAVVWAHQTSDVLQDPVAPPLDEVLARHVSRDGALLDEAFVVARPDASINAVVAASDFACWPIGKILFGKAIREAGAAMPIGPIDALGRINMSPERGGGVVIAWPAPGSTDALYSPALRLVDANGVPGTMYAASEVPRATSDDDVAFADGTIIYMRTGTEPQYGGMSRLFARTFDPAPPRRRGTAR
jgi:hypothetical protein